MQNIECKFTIMPRPYCNNLHGCVIIHYMTTQSFFQFQYQLLIMATFFKQLSIDIVMNKIIHEYITSKSLYQPWFVNRFNPKSAS